MVCVRVGFVMCGACECVGFVTCGVCECVGFVMCGVCMCGFCNVWCVYVWVL